jgi:type II secretory pathway predicted ATPase ExeA
MYYAHFGLDEPPFKITPNTEVFFTGANRGAVLDAVIYAILNGEGIIKVVGEVGSGKTMLCRMLQTLLPEKIESIYLANPSVAPEDVLHAIAFELQLKLPRNADRLKVMQALQKHLLNRHAAGKQVVIFVEEAQGMPIATLEEIRLLSNLETNHDKLLQIVLFGQPELDENLNETKIRQLRERITHSFNLSPLQSQEIGEYLIFRLRSAGYFGPPLFTPAAIKKLSNAAQGLVRRVNILADKSMLAAFAENGYQVKPKHVKAAILDSEFGIEKAKAKAKQYKILWWLGLLSLGLFFGYLASTWYQQQGATVDGSQQTPIKESETKQPIAKPQSKQDKNVSLPPLEASKKAAVVTEPVAGENILTRRLNATSVWLANTSPSTVSIQLMGSSDSLQLKRDLDLLTQEIEVDEIYVYQTKVNGQSFINVLYGSFANRIDATQALRQLPARIQKNRPQLRTIAGVLQEMKQLP